MLGAGAPDNFGISAVAGLDALLALDEGSLGLGGNRWTLTGEVADAATRDAIQTALAGKIDAANWQIAIQARDSAPVVSPYLWAATKAPNGSIDLSGYLPSEALQSFSTVRAGTIGRDTTSIASGEPAGFSDDLLAGLDALSHLTGGKAAFDGSRWVLSGDAASQEQGRGGRSPPSARVAVTARSGPVRSPATRLRYQSPSPQAASRPRRPK